MNTVWRNLLKMWLSIVALGVMSASVSVFAQNPTFEIIPEATDTGAGSGAVAELSDTKSSENFSEIYNRLAKDLWWNGGQSRSGRQIIWECAWLWNQFATGIMNRGTILCLVTQVVRFVSNMALVVWALMIIYAGYIYAMSVFNTDTFGVGKGHEAIKRAVIGIVVVTFSYAILNFVIEAFL